MNEKTNVCRCGYDGEGEHPCHGFAYTCRKPAKSRLEAQTVALAGYQMKVQATETFACDECWERYSRACEKARQAAEEKRQING